VNSPEKDAQILQVMRGICASLSGAEERISHGHPAFAVRKGIFAVLEEYAGELSLCIKVGTETQDLFLKDPRFYKTPYIGNKGWVSLKVHAAPLDWDEIRELLAGSHELIRTCRK
jgi:predicted DNA-binding protein (MmcQ/YjbR family)